MEQSLFRVQWEPQLPRPRAACLLAGCRKRPSADLCLLRADDLERLSQRPITSLSTSGNTYLGCEVCRGLSEAASTCTKDDVQPYQGMGSEVSRPAKPGRGPGLPALLSVFGQLRFHMRCYPKLFCNVSQDPSDLGAVPHIDSQQLAGIHVHLRGFDASKSPCSRADDVCRGRSWQFRFLATCWPMRVSSLAQWWPS